jgi:soluble lytic murein transglycosylase-like protein
VPVALVHRVIMRESRYNATLVGRGGTIGLMQIKLATARGLGYTGSAEGLRDPDTNLAYAVKYLAGAYRAANGDHDRAVRYYAGGYYYVAKRQRLESRVPDTVRNDVMPH